MYLTTVFFLCSLFFPEVNMFVLSVSLFHWPETQIQFFSYTMQSSHITFKILTMLHYKIISFPLGDRNGKVEYSPVLYLKILVLYHLNIEFSKH